MKLNEAKTLISDTLTAARQKMAELNVVAEQNIAEEINDGNGYIYGALVIGRDAVKEEECLFFPIDLQIREGEASEDEAKDAANDFMMKIEALAQRLSDAEDKTKVILEFGEEIQKTRELELLGQVNELEKDTTHNLKVALTAGALMLLVAAICIILSKLF